MVFSVIYTAILNYDQGGLGFEKGSNPDKPALNQPTSLASTEEKRNNHDA
ncbi:hypothetical protein [Hoylesella nanceiensis]|nr:hypothetical protein [Hoylesella nanceiensis]